MGIAANVEVIRQEIAAACARVGRLPESVRLIAVTKNQTPAVLAELAAAGISDIGENRLEHQAEMHLTAVQLGLQVHAIGRIQGRQLATLVPLSDCLHSLSSVDHIHRLVAACAGRAAPFPVFLQVNTSGEAAKAGIEMEHLSAVIQALQVHPCIKIEGLMTMAPEGAEESLVRATFSRLRTLGKQFSVPRLSMGMSQDFTLAIEEGATDIRIGTRLFI